MKILHIRSSQKQVLWWKTSNTEKLDEKRCQGATGVTHHIIVAMLRCQMERNLSFIWLAVDGRTRFQQHLHRLRLPLPSCVVQRPHTCTHTETQDDTYVSTLIRYYWSMSMCLCMRVTHATFSVCAKLTFPSAFYVHIYVGGFSVYVYVCVCVCVFVPISPSPFWSLMSTAACDSSSRVMSSRFPLSAAWCSGENLQYKQRHTHTHTMVTFTFVICELHIFSLFCKWEMPCV